MQGTLSLRARLLVVMTAALLPLLGVYVWGAVRDGRASLELAHSQLRFSASLLAAHQNRVVEAAEQLLGAISQMPEIRAMDPARCQAYFESLRDRYPVYSNIGLIDTEGHVRCHALGSRGTATAADRDYFIEAMRQRRFVVGQPIIGRIVNRPALPFAMPVIEREALVGVVFASFDLQRATRELATAQLPNGARVAVADRMGKIIMEYPDRGKLPRLSTHREMVEAGRTMRPVSGVGPDAHDEARVFEIVPGMPVGEQGFVVRVSLPASALERATWEHVREELLVLAVVTGLAMAAVWLIGGRMIVKPARQILGAAKGIRLGRLDARVPIVVTAQRGEFARIGAAFNLMADSLQMRQSDLEAELKRSRSAYTVLDQVLNSMGEGLIAVTREGRFVLHNTAAARMFPMVDAPVLPELWAAHFGIHHASDNRLYSAGDLPFVRAALGQGEGNALLFVRNRIVTEGRLVQCAWHPMESGSVRGGLVVFSDVTELQRLQSEQAEHLARLQETQRKLLESQRIGRMGNWELDLRTGRLWWSEEAFVLFGVRPEVFGNDLHAFESLVHPDDRAQFKLARDQALRDGKVMSIEFRVPRPDGSVAWMHEISEARRNDMGEPIWFGGVVQDITDRKVIALENARLLAEVRELNAGLESRIAERTAQLQAANEELEAFSYSVSHDLRTPLGAIGGFARALQDRMAGADERTLHYFSRIHASVRKMEELIEALLQLSRVGRAPIECTEVDLGEIARETIESLQLQDPDRKVRVHIEEHLTTRGDPRLLRAALGNLLGNAWKFTSANPHARIEVGRGEDGAFYVRDNGVGFDMAYADNLFNAFHRLHKESEFPGTGIGLATVRRIVMLHRGRVWAQSRPGEGATFYFTL